MKQTWQWKPNQTVVNIHKGYRDRPSRPYRRFHIVPAIGAVIVVIMIVDIIAGIIR